MRELAKMATGLVARPGFGPWLRGALFAGMAVGVWQLWLAGRACGIIVPVAIVLGVLNFTAVMVALVEGGLGNRGLRDTMRWLPLVMWAEMTGDGKDVRLWAILAWPFLLPAELTVCVGMAITVIVVAVGRVLNIRLK